MIKIKPQDLNPTVRKYPRTLQEAFPQHDWETVDKTVHKRSPDDWVVLIAMFGLGFLLGILMGEL